MNRIRTAAAAVALLVGAATVASAQTPAPRGQAEGRPGKAQRGAHGMMGNLDLTDAQKQQIKTIHEKYRAQFEQLQEQQHAEIRAVLTVEQRTKLDARQAQMRERKAQRDSTQGKGRARGMEGRRRHRGARPGRPGQG